MQPAAATEQDEPKARSSRPGKILSTESLVAGLLLAFAVVFNLYHLYPEAVLQPPALNDGVLHRLALERIASALASSQDPTDPWLANLTLGFPLFHYYQSLPYLIPALLTLPVSGSVNLGILLTWLQIFLLSFFPLSIYWAMRRLGFNLLPAALAGLVASLISTNGLYGLDLGSYIWRGYGLYTQLWGMLLLPPALAQGYLTLKTGRGIFWSVLLLAATTLSHLVFGYMAFISLALCAFLPHIGQKPAGPEESHLWKRIIRLAGLLVLIVLVLSYFLVPYVLDRAYLNRSVWEESGKYDAYGSAWTLGSLLRGDLLDFGRFPSLTLLAGLGVLVCLRHWRDERYRLPVLLFGLWLLLYFGRPTWGILLDLIPLSRDLHFHRLIAGVHLGGIFLAGIGLGSTLQWAISQEKSRYLTLITALTALLLLPIYQERGAYLGENDRWMKEAKESVVSEQADLDAILQVLRRSPLGRVYAGLGRNWGKDYRVGAVPVYALLQSAGFDMLGYLYHALSLNADIELLFDETCQDQYNLFNVRYVIAPVERTFPDWVMPIGQFGRHRLYQVATTGYFDLVNSDFALEGDKADFFLTASSWLVSDFPKRGEYPGVFLTGLVEGYTQVYPLAQGTNFQPAVSAGSARGQVVSEKVTDRTYQAVLLVAQPGYVMLKVTYHPNWQVTLDGAAVKPVMLMPSYIGVKVPTGTHRVDFEYRPQPWRRILMLIGMISLCAIPLVSWRRNQIANWLARQHICYRSGWANRSVAAIKIPGWLVLGIKQRLRTGLLPLAAVILFAFLTGLPLFQFKVMRGHDALEYLPRSIEFYEGLRLGQVFPRWAPDLRRNPS
jgi:hypothetical protein